MKTIPRHICPCQITLFTNEVHKVSIQFPQARAGPGRGGAAAGSGGNHGRPPRSSPFHPFRAHLFLGNPIFHTSKSPESPQRCGGGRASGSGAAGLPLAPRGRPPPRGPSVQGLPVRRAKAPSVHMSGQVLPPSQPGCPRESGRAGRLRSGVTGRSPRLRAWVPSALGSERTGSSRPEPGTRPGLTRTAGPKQAPGSCAGCRTKVSSAWGQEWVARAGPTSPTAAAAGWLRAWPLGLDATCGRPGLRAGGQGLAGREGEVPITGERPMLSWGCQPPAAPRVPCGTEACGVGVPRPRSAPSPCEQPRQDPTCSSG